MKTKYAARCWGFLILLTAGFAWIFSSVRHEPLLSTSASQSHARYALEIESDIALRPFDDSPLQQIRQAVSGELHVSFLENVDSRMKMLFQMTPSHVLENGREDLRVTSLFSTAFLATATGGGELVEFQFPNSVALSDRSRLQGLIVPLQLIMRADEQYSTIEHDSLGTFRAAYRREGDKVTKKVLGYSTLKSNIPGDQIRILKSHIEALKPDGDAWPSRLEGIFDSELLRGSVVTGKLYMRWKLHRHSREEALDEGERYDDIVLAFQREAPARDSVYDQVNRELQRKEFAETRVTLASIKEKMEGARDAGSLLGAKNELEDYLNAFPEKISEVKLLILNSPEESATGKAVLNVLQNLGTTDAQSALQEIASTGSVKTGYRLQAILGLGFLESPNEASEATLWSLASGEERELASAAYLMLGRESHSLQSTEEDRSLQIYNQLRDHFDVAQQQDSSQAALLLRAIGNTGRKEAVELASDLMSGNVVRLRALAAESLSPSPDPRADELLAMSLTSDPYESVRQAAAEALEVRQPTAIGMQAAQQALLKEPSAETRLTLARQLLKHGKKYPESYNSLRALAETENDPRVYRVAIQAIR